MRIFENKFTFLLLFDSSYYPFKFSSKKISFKLIVIFKLDNLANPQNPSDKRENIKRQSIHFVHDGKTTRQNRQTDMQTKTEGKYKQTLIHFVHDGKKHF